MKPEEVVEYFLPSRLPNSVLELLYYLLLQEVEQDYPAIRYWKQYEWFEPETKYKEGLRLVFKNLYLLALDVDAGTLIAPIKDMAGLSKEDFITLADLRIPTRYVELEQQKAKTQLEKVEWDKHYGYNSPLPGELQRLRDATRSTYCPIESMAERCKNKSRADTFWELPQFWQNLLNFNVSFNVPSRNEHAMVVGKTGSGKTSLLQKLIYQDIQTDAAVIVMTVKGDMIPTLAQLACIPDERLVLIDPQHPIALNLFDLGDEDESAIELISNIFADADAEVTNKQSTPLHHLIKLLLQYRDSNGQRATIRTLRNLLISKTLPSEFQPYTAQLSQSGKDFFRDSFHRPEFTPSKEQLFWRMEGLLKNSFTERMFCQPESGISFHDIMEKGKVLLVLADEGPLGKEGSQFVLRLMLALVTIAAKNRKDNHERPCYVYCDEISAYLTSNVGTILKRCREKNVSLSLASQDLNDLGELESTIRTNTSTKFVGRCEEGDAKKMAGTMLLDPQTLYTQPKLHFYLKIDAFKHSIPIKVLPGGFKEKPRTIHREHPAPPLPIPTHEPEQSTPDPGTGTSME